jgi:glycosyltransferase involved in cell wall biosynthesis
MDLVWNLRRLRHLGRRFSGSIAIRGWKGTLRRALHSPHNPADGATDRAPIVASVRPPAANFAAKRILIIDSMTPDPTRDSGSMRLCQIFSLLNAAGWMIEFFADYDDASPSDIARLGKLGVSVHHGNPRRWLAIEGESLDAAMLCRLPVADQYLATVRSLAPHALAIFDTVDLHFVREQHAAALWGSRRLARQASRSRRRELEMIGRSDVTFVVSDEERDILVHEAPSARVERVSNIHDAVGRSAPFASRKGLLFVGGFGHPPNEDAVRWFAREVLPQLREAENTIELHIVGDIDDASRRFLEQAGLIVHGRVTDLTSLLGEARLSVAPLRFGAGVKGKVNQAMSHGLPVVLTTIAAKGMHLIHGVDAMIADEPAAMAEAILRAYHDESLWLRLSDAGIDNVRRYFSSECAREALMRGLSEKHA